MWLIQKYQTLGRFFESLYDLAGISMWQKERADCCRLHHLFLLHPHLMPNPCIDTPWQRLYASQSKQVFITTMGLDIKTFHFILQHGFSAAWDSLPIPHSDVSQSGHPHLIWCSLNAKGALGLVLHYLNSTMCEISLQQIFALIPHFNNCFTIFIIFPPNSVAYTLADA